LDLFIWYKSTRGFDDPLVLVRSPRGEWFKTILPNSEWDEIREYLKNRAPVAQKLKRKRVELISSTVNQRSVKRKLAMAKALPAVDGSEKVKIQNKIENPMVTMLFIKPDVKLWYTAHFISFLLAYARDK
jgi:hypothetical protein